MLLMLLALCWLGAIATAEELSCSPNQPLTIRGFFKSKGDIYSPGYTTVGRYSNDLYCSATLLAPYGDHILLTFKDMDVEPYDMCMKDMLSIHEGDNPRTPVHGIFCGNMTKIPPIRSLGSALHLVFRSNFFGTHKGFHIEYSMGQAHVMCPFGKNPCRNRNCYTISEKCNGKDECGDGTDEENCGTSTVPTECGKPAITPKSFYLGRDRIIGGEEATPGSWPWQADLQLIHYYPNGHICGGTLINPEWVLTAAHCVRGNPITHNYRFHFGNHNKFKRDSQEQIRYPQRIIVYPGYTGDQFRGQIDMENDICLLKLNAPVKLTDHVSIACLPSQGQEVAAGTVCMATGWGMTRGSGKSSVLKQVPLSVRKASECANNMLPFVNKTMICVANPEGFQDVCHGDSGGPLVCKINNKYFVMGATSFGTATNYESGLCALPEARTVYSKVSDKISWIQRMVSQYS